jgi:glycosyltransferase involved in cell wall biosynthesis
MDLARAIVELRREGCSVELDVYGPDEGDLPRLLTYVAETRAEEYLTYRGPLAYTDVREALQRYDAMILPSVDEPFPNIVLEALASGIPVICTKLCGLANAVTAAGAGLAADPGPAGLTAAIKQIIDDKDGWIAKRQLALNAARREFGVDALWIALSRVYGSLPRSAA